VIRYFPEMTQGSVEWLQARCGLLTASEMKLIVTPTLKAASNDKERAHLYELLAQRITGYVEPQYIGDDMLRGMEDEIEARALYAKTYAPVIETGFVTNDRHGFIIGYSPDGLVGEFGQIECKSRRQKYQIQTIVENVGEDTIPADYLIQIQTGLIVTERQWCDFISYSGGLPMAVVRCFPDPVIQDGIIAAASAFEARLAKRLSEYRETVASKERRLIPTERRTEQEMFV
jgi:predicted phage-related endonuclease